MSANPARSSGPYFGFSSFREYWLSSSRKGGCHEGETEAEAWDGVMRTLQSRSPHIDSAAFVLNELDRNPGFRIKPGTWYFEMPEARALLPQHLLSAVDRAIGGTP